MGIYLKLNDETAALFLSDVLFDKLDRKKRQL